MSEQQSPFKRDASFAKLQQIYDRTIDGAVLTFMSDDPHDEPLISKELEAQTPGAFVVLLRVGAANEQGERRLEVLLVKRKDYANLWNLPGGGREESECFANAAVREAEEETGLRVKLVEGTKVVMHAGTLDEESEIAGERRYDFCSAAIGVIVGGELRLNEEAAAIMWFPLDELPDGMYKKHKVLVEAYFKPFTRKNNQAIAFAVQEHSFIPDGISD